MFNTLYIMSQQREFRNIEIGVSENWPHAVAAARMGVGEVGEVGGFELPNICLLVR